MKASRGGGIKPVVSGSAAPGLIPIAGGLTPIKTENVESLLREVLVPVKGSRDLEGKRLFTEDEVSLLTGLSWIPNPERAGGPPDGQLLSLNNRPFIFEIVGLVYRLTFPVVYEFLRGILNDNTVTTKDIIFENQLMEKPRSQYLADIERMQTEINVQEGEQCPKCKGVRTLSVRVQMRSGDEAMTLLGNCLDCGFRWKEN